MTTFRSVAASILVLVAIAGDAQAGDIHISWDPNPSGQSVIGYKVYVGTVPGAPTEVFLVGSSTTFTYTPSNPALIYFFSVAAFNGNGEGAKSIEVASPPIFTDSTLTGGVPIKMVHILELRAAIDAARLAAGLLVFSWTDPTLTAGVSVMKLAHITDLQTALAAVYIVRSVAPPAFTTIAPGLFINAAHLMEIRTALVNIL